MKIESLIMRLFSCLALAIAAPPARAGVENILGKWTAKAITPNGPLELELDIKIDGTQLVGSIAGMQGSVPLSNLKFEDPNLSLEVTLAGATFRLTGTLKEGKFDGRYEQVGADLKGPWTAERKAIPALTTTAGGIAGLWNSIAVTPNGDLALKMELRQDSENISGNIGSDAGTISLQAVSFKDSKLQFNVEFGGNAYHIDAILKDDKFTGQWSLVGGTDSGVFTATRQPAIAASPAASGATNLDGVWVSTAVTPDGGTITFDLEIKRAGEALAGNAIAPEGKIPIQKGTIANNALSFEIEYAGAAYRIQAEISGGRLTGKWSAVNSPETGSWSAVRKQ